MRGKILIIDDDSRIRETMMAFFEDAGFEVRDLKNGTTALEVIGSYQPDLILCDIVMPGISGLSILKQIKDVFPSQKVVLVSGLQEAQAQEDASRLGAFDFLAKPIVFKDVEERVLNKLFPPAN